MYRLSRNKLLLEQQDDNDEPVFLAFCSRALSIARKLLGLLWRLSVAIGCNMRRVIETLTTLPERIVRLLRGELSSSHVKVPMRGNLRRPSPKDQRNHGLFPL